MNPDGRHGSKHDRAWHVRCGKRGRNERARIADAQARWIIVEVKSPPTVAFVGAIADVQNPCFRMQGRSS